jgi:hypothetical protein
MVPMPAGGCAAWADRARVLGCEHLDHQRPRDRLVMGAGFEMDRYAHAEQHAASRRHGGALREDTEGRRQTDGSAVRSSAS